MWEIVPDLHFMYKYSSRYICATETIMSCFSVQSDSPKSTCTYYVRPGANVGPFDVVPLAPNFGPVTSRKPAAH